MSSLIDGFRITRYKFPRSRPIGDSQVRITMHYLATLELLSEDGQVGLAVFGSLLFPLPPLSELNRMFTTEVASGMVGQSTAVLLNRRSRPRGGNIRGTIFDHAVNQALWNLHAKTMGKPLYQLLRGTHHRVRSYQDYDHVVEQPIVFKDGYALAPEREGHGLTLYEAARREFARHV